MLETSFRFQKFHLYIEKKKQQITCLQKWSYHNRSNGLKYINTESLTSFLFIYISECYK